MSNKKICILTLAKGKSNRLKNKNMKIFKGKPLLYWTIKKALKITKDYYVNSDDESILKFAKDNGAKTINRNIKLRDDKLPSRILMLDSFKNFPKNTYAVIHVQANSPNLELKKIKLIYEILRKTTVDDIFSIKSNNEINGSCWGITKKKLKKYNMNCNIHDHKSLKNDFWIIDDSVDIHYYKDFIKAEKLFKIK